MLGRFLFNRIGALVLGLLVLGFGFYLYNSTEVKCGSDVMQQGDICITTTDGNSVERTYDEQKSQNALTAYGLMGLGGVFLVGGIIANVRHFRKKSTDAPATESTTA